MNELPVPMSSNAIDSPSATVQWHAVERKPYCCPVCFGKGIVPTGFYDCAWQTGCAYSTAPDICRSCGGTGIVWG